MSGLPLVRRWFMTKTNIEPALVSGTSFEQSVVARMRALDVHDDAEYARRLESDGAEAALAQSLVAVPETWLFRGLASFELLRERLLLRGGPKAAMLSAGCATGAEAWSMAITACAAGIAGGAVHIDAVDLNAVALARVGVARYAGMAIREGVPGWATPWVSVDDEAIGISPALAPCVYAHQADLFSWEPSEAMAYDAIFCRNVLIYLGRDARLRLLERLAGWLAPGGLICVGHADAAGELLPGFVPCAAPAAFAFERGNVAPKPTAREPLPPIATPRLKRGPKSVAPRRPASPPSDAAATQAVDDVAKMLAAAEVEFHRGGLSEAEGILRRVAYLDPRHEQALVRLAEIAERTGRSELADRYRARALKAHLEREG
ncbi:MAG: CheR family methyltransferase [Phycisphaerae bacterium]|nr:CheR family methyltransferase [Phycisphaerae bacterium]